MSEGKGKVPKKRDPNRPLPKPKRRKGKLLKFAISGLTIVLVSWMSLFSVQLGRPPWQWTGEDWSGFLTFSRAQVQEAVDQVQKVDWAGLRDRITAETKKLYDKIPAWENKLDDKIAKLKQEEQAKQEGQPAEEQKQEPDSSEYMQGCTEFREGIRVYKSAFGPQVSEKQQKETLGKALQHFQTAQDHLDKAEQEAKAAGDEQRLAEIDETRQECGRYLYDCVKMNKL